MDDQEKQKAEESFILENQFKSGASWFYWIAGLSIINTIVFLTGGDMSFVVGLGMTQVVDSIAYGLMEEGVSGAKVIAFCIDFVIAGVFVFWGYFAGKRKNWAFIIGMIVYALDGLLFLVIGDWLSIAFHGYALYAIFGGFQAHKKMKILEDPMAGMVH